MNKKGFTLIELMIVVAIMGILAGLITANFVSATEKSRDAKRQSDLVALAKTLMMYESDHGAMAACGSIVDCNGDFAPGQCLSNAMAPYIEHLPTDPSGGAHCYTVCTAGSTCNNTFPGAPYYVQVQMETTGVSQYLYLDNP